MNKVTTSAAIRMIRAASARIGLFARQGIWSGCVGVLLFLSFAYAVEKHGKRFLPLDYEGKIEFESALICGATIVIGGVGSALIAGIPAICSWKSLSIQQKIAGMIPTAIVVSVWIYLVVTTGM